MQTLSKERLGRFTASSGWKLYTGGKTGDSYIFEKAEEIVKGHQKSFSNKDTEHGLENEYEGMQSFGEITGLLVEHGDSKFYKINEDSGATPDGRVVNFSGTVLATVDMKCPTKTFFEQKMMMIESKNPDFQNVPKEMFFQGQIQMLAASINLGYEVNEHYVVRYLTSMDVDYDGNVVEYDLPLETRIFFKKIYKSDFVQHQWLQKVEWAAKQRDQLVEIFKKPIL